MTTTHAEIPPSAVLAAPARVPFKVADLGSAEHGRKEIRLAEHEMPGLMSVRTRYGTEKTPKGAAGSWEAFT